MATSRCSRCADTAPALGFATNGYCVPCNRAYAKGNYHANKVRYFDAARRRESRLDALINGYKDQPCADCGLRYPAYVMDLDHRDPTQKVDKISTMRRRRMAFATIAAEMEKCEVVCSNCHRERTNAQNPARYSAAHEVAA